MIKKLLPLAIVALMIPSAALAKNPNPNKSAHTNNGHTGKSVMYVLKGTLSAYTAYSSPSSPGSIMIDVSHANRHNRALVGQTLTLTVGANTKVVLADGNTTVSDGDLGIVKVRAPKGTDLTSGSYSARQIIDPAKLPNPAADSNAGQGAVMYVLKGKLSAYTAYDSSTSSDGTITIEVLHSNRHGRALVGQTLTFPMVVSSTRVVLHKGATTIGLNDRGIVKVRAPKGTDLASLEGYSVFQIIDQKPAG